jgi:hypothetical protein
MNTSDREWSGVPPLGASAPTRESPVRTPPLRRARNGLQPVAPVSARRDNARAGEVAEWLNAAVLKTVDPQGFGGSNPSLSAIPPLQPAPLLGFLKGRFQLGHQEGHLEKTTDFFSADRPIGCRSFPPLFAIETMQTALV